MIKRTIEPKVKSLAKKYPVISITGPRQSGKTTLTKNVFPDYEYYNLENIALLNSAKADPQSFLGVGTGRKMIIDEIQHFPDLFSYIQVEVDEQKIDGQFIITGSQQFGMIEKITQSLAGRVANFTLLPLSIKELAESNNLKQMNKLDLQIKGFYPRIFDKKINPNDFYSDYIFTYVERDVRQIKNVGDISNFKKFLQLVAGRVGQVVNLASLANDVGVNYKTIESWLSILEASYIIYRLQPYYKNYGKRVIKSPKIYFYDVGVLTYLLGVDSDIKLNTHFAKGMIFENLVISEVYKNIINNKINNKIYYYRENSGNEIDLIIDRGSKQTGIEIKSSQTFKNDFLKGLNFWRELDQDNHDHSILVYTGDISQNVHQHQIVNWEEYLLQLD